MNGQIWISKIMDPSLKKYRETIRWPFQRDGSRHTKTLKMPPQKKGATKRKRAVDDRKVTVYNQTTEEAAVMYASGTEHPKGGNSIAFRTEKGNDNDNAAAVALIEGVIGAGKLKRKTRLPRGDARNWHKTVTEQSCFFDVFEESEGEVIFFTKARATSSPS